ncbi:hypothetical protein Bca4012_048243 [Brassica carinata]
MSYSSCPPLSSASSALTMIERPRRRGFSVSGAKQALVLSEGKGDKALCERERVCCNCGLDISIRVKKLQSIVKRKRRRGRAKGHDAFNEMSFLGLFI